MKEKGTKKITWARGIESDTRNAKQMNMRTSYIAQRPPIELVNLPFGSFNSISERHINWIPHKRGIDKNFGLHWTNRKNKWRNINKMRVLCLSKATGFFKNPWKLLNLSFLFWMVGWWVQTVFWYLQWHGDVILINENFAIFKYN